MDLVNTSGAITITRTPELIAAEINSIKSQTRQIMLNSSIEIGRRLVEAKSFMEHGEWGDWLEQSVSYSKSTANNLMRIFEAYGADQMTLLLDSNAKNEAFGNLSYTQAVALLGLPEGEREAFIEEHDIDSMSTRELQQAIKERDQVLQEKKDIETERDFFRDQLKDEHEKSQKKIQELEELLKDSSLDTESKEALQKQLDAEKQFSTEKENELAEKDKQLQELKKTSAAELVKTKKQIKDLEKQIKELEQKPPQPAEPAGASQKEIDRIKAEAAAEYEIKLNALKDEKDQVEKKVKDLEIKATLQNPTALKYKVYFEELQQVFKNLIGALSELKTTDEKVHDKYQKATFALIDKMSEACKSL
jgi:myosin heavy subunit